MVSVVMIDRIGHSETFGRVGDDTGRPPPRRGNPPEGPADLEGIVSVHRDNRPAEADPLCTLLF